MDVKRREFVKLSGTASALLISGSVSAGLLNNKKDSALNPEQLQALEKTIKANFGDGFSIKASTQENGKTFAKIEHLENYYIVCSNDQLHWKIVSSDIS